MADCSEAVRGLPLFRSGMTSAIFQSDGKVEVPSEQLIISVIGPCITCRASLNTLALVLACSPPPLLGKSRAEDTITMHVDWKKQQPILLVDRCEDLNATEDTTVTLQKRSLLLSRVAGHNTPGEALTPLQGCRSQ